MSQSLIQIDPLEVDATPDAVLHFKSDDFPIRWLTLMAHSRYFRGAPRPTSLLPITSNVSRDSVLQFINATQDSGFFVSGQTAHDLIALSDEFGVEAFKRRVIDWMTANESALLVPTLLFELRCNLDSTATESKIREQFATLLKDTSLRDLPFSLLSRVIDTGVQNVHSFFDFLMTCFGRFGPSASVLFRGLDIGLLSMEEINRMESDGSWIGHSLGIRPGEFFAMLFRSGCCKSGLLRKFRL
jgi:hypothetical protein